MKIATKMRSSGVDVIKTKLYRKVMDDHTTYLKTHEATRKVSIEPMVSYKYAGDFNGLMYHLNIPIEYHYPNMRINGFNNPTDFQGTELELLVADTNILNRITNTLKTSVKKAFI